MFNNLFSAIMRGILHMFGRRHEQGEESLSARVGADRHLQDRDDLTAWFEANASCPDCGSTDFLEGPRGGIAQNVRCGNSACGAWFNTAVVGGHFLFVHRINSDGDDERTLH